VVPGIRAAIERELLSFAIGSGEHSIWIAALAGIDDLMNEPRGSAPFITLDPARNRSSIAYRLTSVTPEDRAWRTSLSVKARRIHAGEAACIAVAVARGIAFATDDNDAAHAYVGFSQRTPEATLSLLKRGVTLWTAPTIQKHGRSGTPQPTLARLADSPVGRNVQTNHSASTSSAADRLARCSDAAVRLHFDGPFDQAQPPRPAMPDLEGGQACRRSGRDGRGGGCGHVVTLQLVSGSAHPSAVGEVMAGSSKVRLVDLTDGWISAKGGVYGVRQPMRGQLVSGSGEVRLAGLTDCGISAVRRGRSSKNGLFRG
jgi:hypothetical protein